MNHTIRFGNRRNEGHLEVTNAWRSDDHRLFEEDGTFIVWCLPNLFGWHCRLEWVLSMVSSERRQGDLWGVSSEGELVIVEAKLLQGSKKPFERLLDFEKARLSGEYADQLCSSDSILEDWKHARDLEAKFYRERATDLAAGVTWNESYRGLAPYSSKRRAVRSWRTLYEKCVEDRIVEKSAYSNHINAALSRSDFPQAVHYAALFAVRDETTPQLSGDDSIRYRELCEMVGFDKVHIRCIQAEKKGDSDAKFSWWHADPS